MYVNYHQNNSYTVMRYKPTTECVKGISEELERLVEALVQSALT